MATTDAFSGLDEAGAWTLGDLERALAGPGRTLEINVHPGAEHDADRARYTWGYTWSSELRALCSDEARAALDRSGRVLVGASNG